MKVVKIQKINTCVAPAKFKLNIEVEGNEEEIQYIYKMIVDGLFD